MHSDEMWKKPGQMSKKMGAVNTICFAILGADMHSRQSSLDFQELTCIPDNKKKARKDLWSSPSFLDQC